MNQRTQQPCPENPPVNPEECTINKQFNYLPDNWRADAVIANQSDGKHRHPISVTDLTEEPQVERVVVVAKVQNTVFDVVDLYPGERRTPI